MNSPLVGAGLRFSAPTERFAFYIEKDHFQTLDCSWVALGLGGKVCFEVTSELQQVNWEFFNTKIDFEHNIKDSIPIFNPRYIFRFF